MLDPPGPGCVADAADGRLSVGEVVFTGRASWAAIKF
jgi:hypothetical protein